MRKHTECVVKFFSEVTALNGKVFLSRSNVVKVRVSSVSDEQYDDVLFKVQMAMYVIPGEHSWGTDGIGYLANKAGNFIEVNKVVTKRVAEEIRKNATNCLCIA